VCADFCDFAYPALSFGAQATENCLLLKTACLLKIFCTLSLKITLITTVAALKTIAKKGTVDFRFYLCREKFCDLRAYFLS
jgi:hypothetical protein